MPSGDSSTEQSCGTSNLDQVSSIRRREMPPDSLRIQKIFSKFEVFAITEFT